MITHRRPELAAPSRVVVLGASGFVARNLLGYLATRGIATLPVGSSQIDLRAPESTEALVGVIRPDDALVFVSALTPDRGRDIRTLMANLAMAEHVCAALARGPCAHVVYVSSDAVYADDAHPVRETSCCCASSFHGVMHLARERMLALTLQKVGTPLFIVRPSLLFGAGDTHNGYGPNRFIRSARAEKRITLFGDGEEKRDHVSINDLSLLIGLGLGHQSAGTLNVATGSSVSFYDVARLVADAVGKDVEVECTPRQNPVTHRFFDITETLKAFPNFRYMPLETALEEFVAMPTKG
jgi:nucleoside-diphosphate-sugar epimerase